MTADRIQYFEERLKKPIPEPFKSWMEELFAEATGNQGTQVKAINLMAQDELDADTRRKYQQKPKQDFKPSKSLSIRPDDQGALMEE